VLRGISPLIWRRLLVRSESTMAQLHEVLQIGLDVRGLLKVPFSKIDH